MKENLHKKLQASIDRMQGNNDELSLLLQTLCRKLGDLIGYKHRKKRYYRVLVSINGEEYDVYDLIKQTEKYFERNR